MSTPSRPALGAAPLPAHAAAGAGVICFIHIERAGGTTLHAIFRNNFPLGFLTLTPWYLWSNQPGSELTARELRWLLRLFPFVRGFGGHTSRSYLGYERALGRPVRYVTFLREPLARYISHYHHQVRHMHKPWTIDSFLAERRFDNYMTRRIAGSPALERAKRELAERFAFVGLTERFDESLVLMRRQLGLERFDIRYQKQNVSRQPGYRREPRLAQPEVLERIRDRNRLDLELYRFAREELFPRYLARFGPGLDAALAAQRASNQGYRFSRARRLLWLGFRHLVYRHAEYAVHKLSRPRRA